MKKAAKQKEQQHKRLIKIKEKQITLSIAEGFAPFSRSNFTHKVCFFLAPLINGVSPSYKEIVKLTSLNNSF